MDDHQLQSIVNELKKKATETIQLQKRRDELIQIFKSQNIDLPEEVKTNTELKLDEDIEQLEKMILALTWENLALKNKLIKFKQMEDERVMISNVNNVLNNCLDKLKTADSPESIKVLLNEFFGKQIIDQLTYRKVKLEDDLVKNDCKIDVLSCKLSQINNKLQEPLREVNNKKQCDLPLTDEELKLLNIAETSLINSRLKKRIAKLTEINNKYYKENEKLEENAIKSLHYLDFKGLDCERLGYPHLVDDEELASSVPIVVTSSYTVNAYDTSAVCNQLGLTLLGYRALETQKFHQNVTKIRKELIQRMGSLQGFLFDDG